MMDMRNLEQAYERVHELAPGAGATCAMILGTGWSSLAEIVSIKETIDYAEIPGLGAPGVDGHSGLLHIGDRGNLSVVVFQGRRHWYEGLGWEPVALPVYLSQRLEATTLILTNAAGGISEALHSGDIMVIDDHINFMGVNPLVGPHQKFWGQRFPDQSGVYDTQLRELMDASGRDELPHGVYAATSGPAYETPAEVEVLRRLGADAVGMSTVPEASLAHAAGMRVLGLSCISNMAAGLTACPLRHEDVINQAQAALPRMRALLERFLDRLAADGTE